MRPGLGRELLLSVDSAVAQLRRNPRAFRIVHKDVRRVLVRRFPYGVFYFTEGERIVVLAVFHGRRDPRVVRRRR
ncbi:MAG: type II toxin-antitoxin system RelE/ParE family toxin [Planctomycetales bacterium]|nr:type II toxin-antitoxin system RelE/ParE family toxin [Planctomycetales bacterium]